MRYRRKKDPKTSKRHTSSITSEKPHTSVSSIPASDDSKGICKLPTFTHDECSSRPPTPHLKPTCWSTHTAAQNVDVANPSPDHMLNDRQLQTANLQQKYNLVYPTSQPESQLDLTAQHHHIKPWYSTLSSQRMNQSNQTDRQHHHMLSSADWPKQNCTVSYQQQNIQFCLTNHGSNPHPTSHSTQEPTYFEDNLNPPQGYPYQYFPLRYPGASQTSIHNWDMINQHSMPSYHPQPVIPLSTTCHTVSETQLLPIVGRSHGNQPNLVDATQRTLPSQRYLQPQYLPTYSKPCQQIFNEYSSPGDGPYPEDFQGCPSMDPFNIEMIQTQGSQPVNVQTTQDLLESQTSSSTQVLISDPRQGSSDIASPACI